MSNHLSKSLFSIPRLKKSRSRQQNQPENPTSLCLNALTADDAFLRFAAALDKTFFSPRNPKRNSIFSLYIHSPQPRPEAPALHYNTFSPIDRLSTTRGIYSPYMPNTSNDRARNALRSTETEKFSRPQTLRPPQIGVQGRPYKMNTRKNRIHRRGGRRGIISGGMGGGEDNNTEIWDGRERAGDIIIWKYMTAERRRGI